MAEIHDTFLELGSVDSAHERHGDGKSSSISTTTKTNVHTNTSEVTVSITVSKTCKRVIYVSIALSVAALMGVLLVVLSSSSDSRVVTINVPVWKSSATLDYSIFREGRNSELVRAISVVGGGTDEDRNTEANLQHYILGSEGIDDAVNHAVNNMFPFFGRITSENLSVYENGEPQPIFGSFPIVSTSVQSETDSSWEFSLLNRAWRGNITSVTANVVTFQAVERKINSNHAPTTYILDYSLDVGAGFLGHMTLTETQANPTKKRQEKKIFDLTLNKHSPAGSYSGKAFFVRATDILDRIYSNNDTMHTSMSKGNAESNETFSVGQHRKDGPWDFLVYSVDATVDCMKGNKASLTLTGMNNDGSVAPIALDKSFARCVQETASTGTIAQPLTPQYIVSAKLAGGSTTLRLRIAGGLLYTYTVKP